MWNQILNQSRSLHKYQNVPILVLGNKHSGKRTFIDSLFEISKTVLPRRTATQLGRLRDKTISSVIDYAYLNTINLNDPDNKSQSRLQFYIVDDQQNKEITEVLVNNPSLIEKLVIVIMLDYSAPWTFEIQLEKWTTFAKYLLSKTGFSISKLDEMKNSIQKNYTSYKQPQFDEDGKLKKKLINSQQKIEESIPLPQGILTNNIRLPLIVTVNKSDLQSSVLRDKQKISFVEYHLRKFCMTYGGSLIYTSTKNHLNLDVFYEYILHRVYKYPLRFKPYTLNEQSIFIPLGADNFELLNDSIKVSDQSYSEVIPPPLIKKLQKQQVQVQEDTQFFKKFLNVSTVVSNTAKINTELTTSKTIQEKLNSSTINSGPQKSNQVKTFYDNLLKASSGRSTIGGSTSDPRRLQAFEALNKHTSKASDPNSSMAKKLLEISQKRQIKKEQKKQDQQDKNI